jgi:hypothetical protein
VFRRVLHFMATATVVLTFLHELPAPVQRWGEEAVRIVCLDTAPRLAESALTTLQRLREH